MSPLHALFAESTIDRLFDVIVIEYGWLALVALGAILVTKAVSSLIRHSRRKRSMTEILAAAESAKKTYRLREGAGQDLAVPQEDVLSTPLISDEDTRAGEDTVEVKIDSFQLEEAEDASGGQFGKRSEQDQNIYAKMMAFRSGRFGGADFGAFNYDLDGPVRPPTLRRANRRGIVQSGGATASAGATDSAPPPDATARRPKAVRDTSTAETLLTPTAPPAGDKPSAIAFRIDRSPPPPPPPPSPSSSNPSAPPPELDGMFGNVMRQGDAAEAAGDLKTAAHFYSVAMAIHPDSEEARSRHAQVKARIR